MRFFFMLFRTYTLYYPFVFKYRRGEELCHVWIVHYGNSSGENASPARCQATHLRIEDLRSGKRLIGLYQIQDFVGHLVVCIPRHITQLFMMNGLMSPCPWTAGAIDRKHNTRLNVGSSSTPLKLRHSIILFFCKIMEYMGDLKRLDFTCFPHSKESGIQSLLYSILRLTICLFSS